MPPGKTMKTTVASPVRIMTLLRVFSPCTLAVLCSLIILTRSNTSAYAQDSAYQSRIYTTKYADPAPPQIDGDLSDRCWENVEWSGDFTQWEPTSGARPSQQTKFKIVYDDEALYVAYRVYDTNPELIDDILARRDWFPGDWVEINIDSHLDKRTAYSFTCSVSGTKNDEFVSGDGNNWDTNWDPIWEFKTRIDEEGWTAEARIPFSQLRYGNKEEHVWGIQVTRRFFREEERSTWQPISNDESGWVSRFGELHGIRGIRAQRQIEILPYSLAKSERSEQVTGDPFNDGSASKINFGVDGKFGVTSDLTLDFTVNPDFGQVEADPSEVNLSAFETFFDEKRPFFIEGSSILDFRIAPAIAGGSFTRDNLFYSRRIGLRPHHDPDLADSDEYAELPSNTSILGAFKLTGKTKKGLSIGIMENMTAKESAEIEFLGNRRKETVEPFTNFFVARVEQDINKGDTRIGGMVTAVNRNIEEAHLDFLHRSAYSGGVNFFQYWKNRSWQFSANGAVSRVQGDAQALLETQTSSARYYQRPDNDYRSLDSTRTTLSGHAGSVRVARTSGSGPLRFETGVAWRSPGFEANDIGFMRRADEINQFAYFGYSVREPVGIFRRFRIDTRQHLDWDFGGTNLLRRGDLNFNANTRGNWSFDTELTRILETTSNTELRGGPSSRWPGESEAKFRVDSDSRARLSFRVGGTLAQGDEESSSTRKGWFTVAYRPSNAIRLSVNPSYTANKRELQYIQTSSFAGEDRYLFGRLDQKIAALTLRVDYTITPNLTVQFYGAPFVSTGEYTDFKRITNPLADAYTDRFREFTGAEIQFDPANEVYNVDEDGDTSTDYQIENPNFNFREFNSNLVVRWEFQPGSLLYLVWSQSRENIGSSGMFSLGDEYDALFRQHPQNIFLIKVSKWFSL